MLVRINRQKQPQSGTERFLVPVPEEWARAHYLSGKGEVQLIEQGSELVLVKLTDEQAEQYRRERRYVRR